MSDISWLAADAATLVLAFVAGVLSGAFSMGGQILMKPGIRVLGVSALDAVGTTVPMILPTVTAATIRYWRQGLVDWSSVRAVVPIGVVTSIAGAAAAPHVPGRGHLLQVLTAALMIFGAIRMTRGENSPAVAQEKGAELVSTVAVRRGGVMLVGGLSGLASGILGVGGGVVMVPLFSQVAHMPLRVSIATSLVCAGAFAIPATITHTLVGTIDWRFAILLTVGAIPGARVGAAFAIKTSDRRLRLAVGSLMSIIAVIYGASEVIAWMNAD